MTQPPEKGTLLTEQQRALVVRALADAIDYRLDGADTGEGGVNNCNDCAADPDGYCDDHQADHEKADDYQYLYKILYRKGDE